MSSNTNNNQQAQAQAQATTHSQQGFQTLHATRIEAGMSPHTTQPHAPPARQTLRARPHAPPARQTLPAIQPLQADNLITRQPTPIVTRQ
jgi:hypothetical protein